MEPDTYPPEWTPHHIKERQAAQDAVMLGVDVIVAGLSDQEFNDLVTRTRGGGDR